MNRCMNVTTGRINNESLYECNHREDQQVARQTSQRHDMT